MLPDRIELSTSPLPTEQTLQGYAAAEKARVKALAKAQGAPTPSSLNSGPTARRHGAAGKYARKRDPLSLSRRPVPIALLCAALDGLRILTGPVDGSDP